MKVKDIMTNHVVALHDSMSFLDAAKTFLAYHLSGAPVINNAGELIGLLSEKDLMRAMYPTYHQIYTSPRFFLHDEEIKSAAELAEQKTVGDIMSTRLITTTPETQIWKVGGHMVASGVHRVPVIDENRKLVGMVSRGDVYRAMLEEEFKVYTFNHKQKLLVS